VPKQRIIIIIGIVLAVLAVVLVKFYLDQQGDLARREAEDKLRRTQENQTPVLVAKKDILPNSIIEPDSFDVGLVPNQYVAPGAITSLVQIAGMITTAPIPKGEQITRSKLAYPKQAGGLAGVTPIGKRAITISVDNIASLAGMIKPGDFVDVIVMIPVPVQGPDGKQVMDARIIPLFQNVSVLAVGQDTGGVVQPGSRYDKEGQGESSPLITLALTPQEANLIAFVQEQGKIRLVMRNPADAATELPQTTGWEALLPYLRPQQMPQEPTELQPSAYVEIYRGLNKEKVPLSK